MMRVRNVVFCVLLHSQGLVSPTTVLQLTGTTELDNQAEKLRKGVTHLASVSKTGLVLAVLVTGLVYLASLLFPTTAKLYTRRKGPVLARRVSRIFSYLSANSLDDLIDTIKPGVGTLDILPDISRMSSGAMESAGSLTNMVSGGVYDSIESVSDTAGTLSRVVSDKKIKDCLLQAICYLTPEESGEKIYGRGVGVVVARVVNDPNIQCLNPDDEGGGKLTAPVSIHHYFPSISRQSRVFVNEAA